MARIAIDIEKCTDGCPYCEERFCGRDFVCTYGDRRNIAVYVECPSEIPSVPEWCPIKVRHKVLTEKESEEFIRNLVNPDKDYMDFRDRIFRENDQHLRIESHGNSFVVNIDGWDVDL